MSWKLPSLYLIDGVGQSLSLIQSNQFISHGSLAPTPECIPIQEASRVLAPDSIIFANIDPFSNLKLINATLRFLPFRKVASVSDTHHGTLPVTRVAYFCCSSGIDSIILRFNQRHACWFERLGISTFPTIFSPDLSFLIQSGIMSELLNSPRDKGVIHVGALSQHHILRKKIYLQLRDKGLVDWNRYPNAKDMLNSMANYKASLNISLNLDFNRRIIESMIAGCQVLSDEIEEAQLCHPFSLLKYHISWYSSIAQLKELLESEHRGGIEAAKAIQTMHISGYDTSQRLKLIQKVHSSPYRLSPHLRDLYLAYDYFQECTRKGILEASHLKSVEALTFHSEHTLVSSITSLVQLGLRRCASFD